MSIPTSTNYISNNENYSNQDLITIFQTYSSIQVSANPTTNYKISGNYDLGQIFVQATPIGTALNTGFNAVISGTTYDLAKIFNSSIISSIPFTATGTYSYIYDYTNSKYYLTFTN
jgi:hypothetical protein